MTFVFCFLVAVASAVVPWVNGEVMVLALAAAVAAERDLVGLALAAAAGQMTGKAVMYWAARGGATLPGARVATQLDIWRARFEERPGQSLGLMCVSAFAGVPPFYLMTLVAGALRFPFAVFLAIGIAGRFLHFLAVVLVPRLVMNRIAL